MKAKVKDGVTYGAGGKYPAGTVLDVTQAELDAFGDKLELLAPPPLATKQAAELAEILDVDLSTLTGTGHDGRITVPDVRAASEG